jgi:hypothetical protein
MKIILPENKTYVPGAGRCIYCWPRKFTIDTLAREHIIPKAISGKLVFHNASCANCADLINSEIENPTLQRMWLTPRTRLRMPTSRPRDTLPYGTWTSDSPGLPQDMGDVDFDFEQIAVEDHPFTISFPCLAPPGILWDEPPSPTFPLIGVSIYRDPSAPPLPNFPGKQSAELQPFDPGVICRSIAKIAHGAAVAELGFDKFEPMLPDVILGREPNVSHLVGGTLMSRGKRAILHQITLFIRREFVLAEVQLFSRYGIQPFLAVVGRASDDLLKWRMSTLIKIRPKQYAA